MLAAVAVAGMLLTAYLSYGAWTQTQLAYCDAGSGCDLVQASRWSSFLGIPMAAWGFATYAGLAVIALLAVKPVLRWRSTTLLATVGLAISIYLTAVSIWKIEAVCPYCLASLGLITVAYLLSWRPLAKAGKRNWRIGSVVCAGTVVILLHLHYSGLFDPMAGPEDPYLRDLAQHLSDSGAVFYGAYWCPHCQQQKSTFGAAARHLPYVECTPHGRRAPRATECEAHTINNYPTWTFGVHRVERHLSARELARITKFRSPPAESAPNG
jgi:uncharacterized membrane protein